MTMPMRLQTTMVRQTREPARAIVSRAMKTYAAHSTGPHPVRLMANVIAATWQITRRSRVSAAPAPLT